MPADHDYSYAIRGAIRDVNAALSAIPHRDSGATPAERHAASARFRDAYRRLYAIEDARDAGLPIPDRQTARPAEEE